MEKIASEQTLRMKVNKAKLQDEWQTSYKQLGEKCKFKSFIYQPPSTFRVFPQLSVERVTVTPFISIKEGRIMNFGGHLEKFGGQNPQNSKTQGGHGKPCTFITDKQIIENT